MNARSLQKTLSKFKIGGLRYFASIGSTNDEALAWATQGAADFSVIVADEQTSGRGREGRQWFTPSGTALAFSLILRPTTTESPHLSRIVGLAAVALAEALRKRSLKPQIKWPNDILLEGSKVAGILVESVWSGDQVDCAVIGIGVNVAREAVPPPELLHFPATSLENALGAEPKREAVLHDILSAFLAWRPQVTNKAILQAWEDNLAFRGQLVQATGRDGQITEGTLLGLESDGSLRLLGKNGNPVTVSFGDVRLRPSA